VYVIIYLCMYVWMTASIVPELLDECYSYLMFKQCIYHWSLLDEYQRFISKKNCPSRSVPKKQKSSFLENGSDRLWIVEQFKINVAKANCTSI
jgi:hypothetical protein